MSLVAEREQQDTPQMVQFVLSIGEIGICDQKECLRASNFFLFPKWDSRKIFIYNKKK